MKIKPTNKIARLPAKPDEAEVLLLSEFKKELRRLRKENAKLKVRHISDQAEIAELKKLQPNLIVQMAPSSIVMPKRGRQHPNQAPEATGVPAPQH
ncbi:MAG: hypothetical protein WCS01_14105 [bacterium]